MNDYIFKEAIMKSGTAELIWTPEKHEMVVAAICNLHSLSKIKRHFTGDGKLYLRARRIRTYCDDNFGELRVVFSENRPESVAAFYEGKLMRRWYKGKYFYGSHDEDGAFEIAHLGDRLLAYYAAHGLFHIKKYKKMEWEYSDDFVCRFAEYIDDNLRIWEKYKIGPSRELPEGAPPYWGHNAVEWQSNNFPYFYTFNIGDKVVRLAAAFNCEWRTIKRCESGKEQWILESTQGNGLVLKIQFSPGTETLTMSNDGFKDKWKYKIGTYEHTEFSDNAQIAADIAARALFCLGRGSDLYILEDALNLSISYTQRLEWQQHFCETYPSRLWPAEWKTTPSAA